MRNIVTIILSALLLLAGIQTANAQNKEDWREKIMSEKIAFLTSELNITPQEAQTFWPVYNQVNKEKDEAMHEVFRAYKAMSSAIKDNKSAKEINNLLDKYLSALEKQRELDNKTPDRYKKVLPVEKVAKLYVAEERFRRQQIHRLHHHKGGEKKN